MTREEFVIEQLKNDIGEMRAEIHSLSFNVLVQNERIKELEEKKEEVDK